MSDFSEASATLRKLKVTQLKQLLREMEMPVSGKKAQLIERLITLTHCTRVELEERIARFETNNPKRCTVTEKTDSSSSSTSSSAPFRGKKRSFIRRRPISLGVKDRIQRAMTQRFYIVDHMFEDKERRYVFQVLGSTGNLYKVFICEQPYCTCPDSVKQGICKHILFVYIRIAGLNETDNTICQHYHDSHSLDRILAQFKQKLKRLDTNVVAHQDVRDAVNGKKQAEKVKRKNLSDPCSICFEEMIEREEEIDWCRKVCGGNFHKSCVSKWLSVNNGCPLCRSPWGGVNDQVYNEGIRNFAHLQPGVSTERDTSTYRW
eukprot:CAMPEP_0184015068 /NCGR_PEP_ID=MMETSP0954-20121128/6083_1 /TAXON_ID=627963 /ORGANISM="Aplanochytrium sp, Strain PBS07" /LENGTH=318 /DNA_ID=CAMNT_0026295767 /DNA_START=51 /DNA_END=1004 /DNA_ORIENTATION=+